MKIIELVLSKVKDGGLSGHFKLLFNGILFFNVDSSDGEMEHDKQHPKARFPSYDTSKLIDYAGFNAVIPKGIQDVSIALGIVQSVFLLVHICSMFFVNVYVLRS